MVMMGRNYELNREYFMQETSQIVFLPLHVCYSNRLLNVELLRRRCWMLECELSVNGITRSGSDGSIGEKPVPLLLRGLKL